MSEHPIFLDKELSWLSFNERVLQEAADPTVPPIERVRFLGIYSSNLDEFFRVRVADIRRRILISQSKGQESSEAELLMDQINAKVAKLTDRFSEVSEEVFYALKRHHIHLLKDSDVLSSFQISWIKGYFNRQVLRHITPIIMSKHVVLEDCIEDESSYLLVCMANGDDTQYAFVEIPQEVPRFIQLPPEGSRKEKYILMLDDVIEHCLDDIFAGLFEYDTIEAYSIKMTRDAQYDLDDEVDQGVLEKMSKGLKQRLTAEPVRLVYDRNMPGQMMKFLRKKLKLKSIDNMIPSVRYRNFRDFIGFPNVGRKYLEHKEIGSLDSAGFYGHQTVFSAIAEKDILLYYPYHKFRHFTDFIRQASYDPAVSSIKINIYRVAKNSEIINSLIEAVKNGKQVTVVVELRARFDEEANIEWAKVMQDAGIHVEFGIRSLKVHSKLCLVSRMEEGKVVRYAHIGTGNFHEKTARVYTDFTLFTCHKEITQEVENVFSFIEHSYKRFRFNHLIVSPLTSRRRLYQLIDQEIANAEAGKKAEILFKVNNLVDTGLINRLYAASKAGVKIRAIVRGMCSLVPGVADLSKNIRIISIVDQFLEHPRVAVFHNGGDKQVYISSADWMTRNIDQRVEVGCPIYDPDLKKRIITILELHFKDTTKARVINRKQDNRYVPRGNRRKIRSQIAIYEYLAEEEKRLINEKMQAEEENINDS